MGTGHGTLLLLRVIMDADITPVLGPMVSVNAPADAVDLLTATLPPPIERVETHISTVLFSDGWAYKVKKPVRFEFIDLSTPQLREEDCRREFDLNRRFAPDVYDSVIEIRNPAGEVVDHAVKMRRMPVDRRLTTLLATLNDLRDPIREIAKRVAVAHEAADRGPRIDAVATADAVRHLWRRSLDDLATLPAAAGEHDRLAMIDSLAMRYLDGRAELFGHRIASGHIVDGHGDLLADDIFCLSDGPRILDWLEFDDQLRFGVVLLDLGVLAMDLERLGRADLADTLLNDYREFTNEVHPSSLFDHYVAYRALVRAKIATIRGVDASDYLELCLARLRRADVRVVIVGGLPAAGKSTVAADLGRSLGWTVLVADVVRKEVTHVGPGPAAAEFGQGIYSRAGTELTYTELMHRARVALRGGESVVIDASFADERWRAAARVVAAATASAFVELRCVAPAEVCAERLRHRRHDEANPSDATEAIAVRMTATFDPWPSAIEIGTSRPLPETMRDAMAAVDRISR